MGALSALPPEWLECALAPPRASAHPSAQACLKKEPEDFKVSERLGFVADGGSAHVLLEVEKRGRDTLGVARQLARAAGVPSRDVGFAGLKDRVAVATQWFTVPATQTAAQWMLQEGDGFKVLRAEPHSRKLRRGALQGNHFQIRLTELGGDTSTLQARLEALPSTGVPNYFGLQRFGREGSNLFAVQRLLESGRLPAGREARGFVLSAARALVFNAVLAERVQQGSWNQLLPGELVNLDGRGSWFVADLIDATLLARLEALDIHPTGPLAGARSESVGASRALEDAVLERFQPLPAVLEQVGLEAARRPLRVIPREFVASWQGNTLDLSFVLPPGAYATMVVRELVATSDATVEGHDD